MGAPIAASDGVEKKRFATAQAKTALWGGRLSEIEGDDGRPLLIISRWALTRAFQDLGEVEEFLRRVEGQAS